MLIGREAIAGMIPHAGAMRLLDGVLSWDTERIECVSRTHRDPHNPLRSQGQLAALCGIEYAAQAMAIHGRLAGALESAPRAGYLASLREVVCRAARLDDLEGDLVVGAERLMGEESRVIYRFALRVGETDVLRGRAAVVLDTGRVRP
jgi:predicted hotdog family 3-hydroxylacyl-ACP dehydratase